MTKEVRILPSDPRYAAYTELMSLLGMACNPSMHFLTWGDGNNLKQIIEKQFDDQNAADDLRQKLLDALERLMNNDS